MSSRRVALWDRVSIAWGLLQLAFALLGGNSIAGERIDRSAEFLAYLPVSRRMGPACQQAPGGAGSGPAGLASEPRGSGDCLSIPQVAPFLRPIVDLLSVLGTIAVTGLTFSCVAWLFSCLLESPTFSVCAGLIVPLVVMTGIFWVLYLLDVRT